MLGFARCSVRGTVAIMIAILVSLQMGKPLWAQAPEAFPGAPSVAARAEAAKSPDKPDKKVLRVLIRPGYAPLTRRQLLAGFDKLRDRKYGDDIVIQWEDLLDHRFYAGYAPEINEAMTVIETPDRVYFEDAGYSLQKLTFRSDYFNLAATENEIYTQTWSGSRLLSRINAADFGQIWVRYQLKEIEDLNEPLDRHLVRMLTKF